MKINDFVITDSEIGLLNVKSAKDTYKNTDTQANKNIFDRLPEHIAGRYNQLIDALTQRGAPVQSRDIVQLAVAKNGDLQMSADGESWQNVADYGLGQKADKNQVYIKGETYSKTQADSLLAKKADKNNVYTKGETDSAINQRILEIGGADMTKAVYDSDNTGVVDDAQRLGGKLASLYALKDDLKKIDFFGQGESISSNSDLNKVTDTGKHYASAAAVAQTFANCPTETNFGMFVFDRTSKGMLSQLIIDNNGRIHLRSESTSGWGGWKTCATTAELSEIMGSMPAKKLLWENPNPEESFVNNQLIAFDKSGYGRFGVDYRKKYNDHTQLYTEVENGGTGALMWTDVSQTASRGFDVEEGGIRFYTGHLYDVAQKNELEKNLACVPVRIYGIRTEGMQV